jgi:hypothetical protein
MLHRGACTLFPYHHLASFPGILWRIPQKNVQSWTISPGQHCTAKLLPYAVPPDGERLLISYVQPPPLPKELGSIPEDSWLTEATYTITNNDSIGATVCKTVMLAGATSLIITLFV